MRPGFAEDAFFLEQGNSPAGFRALRLQSGRFVFWECGS
jgi:hypothetical protein